MTGHNVKGILYLGWAVTSEPMQIRSRFFLLRAEGMTWDSEMELSICMKLCFLQRCYEGNPSLLFSINCCFWVVENRVTRNSEFIKKKEAIFVKRLCAMQHWKSFCFWLLFISNHINEWHYLQSHQWVTPSTHKKEFWSYLHLFRSYSSNKVKSVNYILIP